MVEPDYAGLLTWQIVRTE